MIHLQDEHCMKTYKNQQIIQPNFVITQHAEKAESLIKGYQKFATHVSTLRKNQQPDSKKKSFIVLKKMIHDPH